MAVEVNPNTVVSVDAQTTPAEQFDQASATKDPVALLDVAKNNFNTPVGQAAFGLADHLYKTGKEFDNLVAPIAKAGGPNTPDGRLAAIKVFESSKTDPTIGEVLMHYVTGNGAYARDLVTGGKVSAEIRPDKNGQLVKVWSNAFGPMRARVMGSNTDLSEQEFQDRGVGRQKYEDTLNYLSQKQISEDNNKEWQAKIKRDSQAEQAYSTIVPLAERTDQDLEWLKNLDIDPKRRAELIKTINYSISNASRAGVSDTAFSQMQSDAQNKIDKAVDDKTRMELNLVGAWKYSKEGVVNEKTGETRSWSQLKNLQSTANRSNENESRLTSDRDSMVKYLRTAQLSKDPKENKILQDRVLRMYDSTKELSRSLLEIHGKGKGPKFLYTPNVSEADDPYAITRGKLTQLVTNGKLLQAQTDYASKVYNAARESGEIMPNPYEIEKGFTRSESAKSLIKQGMDRTEQIISEYTPRVENRPRQGAVVPPQGVAMPERTIPTQPDVTVPATIPAATANAASNANRVNPKASIAPAGFEVVPGKFDANGKPLLRKRGSE